MNAYFYVSDAFIVSLATLIPICLYFTLAPATWWPWFWDQIEIVPHPSLPFRITLVEFAFLHFILAFILEVMD